MGKTLEQLSKKIPKAKPDSEIFSGNYIVGEVRSPGALKRLRDRLKNKAKK